MLQSGGCARFLAQPLALAVVSCARLRKRLEGDAAMQACVFSLVHDAHAAAARHAQDSILADLRTGWTHGLFGCGR